MPRNRILLVFSLRTHPSLRHNRLETSLLNEGLVLFPGINFARVDVLHPALIFAGQEDASVWINLVGVELQGQGLLIDAHRFEGQAQHYEHFLHALIDCLLCFQAGEVDRLL